MNISGLLTGCRKKKKIVRVLGGKLCGEKWRLCGTAQSCDQSNISICDPPRDLGYFGVDTRTTRSHGRTKETRFNMEQPYQDISSLKFSFV